MSNGKRRGTRVDVGTTASRVGGSMGKPKSAAQKLLASGNLRQKYNAWRAITKSKSLSSGPRRKR